MWTLYLKYRSYCWVDIVFQFYWFKIFQKKQEQLEVERLQKEKEDQELKAQVSSCCILF